MKNKMIVMAMAMMLYVISGYGQIPHATINVAAHVMLTSTWDQFEPSIAVDKLHAPNLLASFTTTYYSNTSQYNYQGWQYFSPIGSITPLNATTSMPNSAQSHGAPGTTFDAGGRATLWGTNGDETGFFDVTTDDDCSMWNTPTTNTPVTYGPSSPFSGDYRFPSYAVDDVPNSPNINNYYAAWTDLANSATVIKTQRSTDRGGSFGDEKQLNAGSTAYGANIQTGENGQVYVAWANYVYDIHAATNYVPQFIGFASSTDGGLSYPDTNSQKISYTGFQDYTYGNTDFNSTYVNSYPVMAVDKSCNPAHRGWIYLVAACPTYPSGSVINLWISQDHGGSWSPHFDPMAGAFVSTPIVINMPSLDHSWFPSIAVDDLTGVVSVAYYGSTGSVVGNTNTFVAFCDPTDPTLAANWQSIQVSGSTAQTPETYSSLIIHPSGFPLASTNDRGTAIASYGGHAYPAWKDRASGTGIRQIWTADVQYDAVQLASSATTINLLCNPTSPTTISSEKFEAENEINIALCGGAVSIGSVTTPAKVNTTAGQSIVIGQGFVTAPGSVFTAEIRPTSGCQTPGIQSFKTNPTNTVADNTVTNTTVNGVKVNCYPNPTTDLITISVTNNNYQNSSFMVTDMTGKQMAEYNSPNINGSNISQVIDASAYAQGLYIITMKADSQKYSFKFTKE